MSYLEAANELIKNYLPPGVNERQLAAFQTYFAPTIIAKLKVADNVSDAALINDKVFSTLIPESFKTFIGDNQLVDANKIGAPNVGLKSTLIQRTLMPDENTARESMQQSIIDSVRADLFSWRQSDLGVGVNNDLMLDNVRAFNDIRMQGELMCPRAPDDLAEPQLEGSFVKPFSTDREVVADFRTRAKRDVNAAKLVYSDKYTNNSGMDLTKPLLCPFELPRRNTPFVPVNTLEPYGFMPEVDTNGLPIEYMRKQIFHRDSASLRQPLAPDQTKPMDIKNRRDPSIYNIVY